MKTVYLALALALSVLFPASVRAELKFDQTTIELKPAIGDKQAIAHFKYENVGKTPIKVKSARASCGCTVAQSQKEEIAPGDKGEITATFTIGDRTGPQLKTITVETDDTVQPKTVLTLKANIPELLKLQPNFVYWRAGEEAKPKTIVATAGKDVPIKKLDVASMNPQFKVTVEPGSAPGEFRVNVQPAQTDKPAAGAIVIKSDYPKGAPKTLYVSARVMGTPAPTARAAAVPLPPAPARVARTPASATP